MKYLQYLESFINALPRMTPQDWHRFLRQIQLFRIHDQIYTVRVADNHVRALVFMRVQEYYENQNPAFYQNDFEIAEFIRWYREEFRDHEYFTYGDDWNGFNIPSHVLEQAQGTIPDRNIWDEILQAITDRIREEETKPFYLLGIDFSQGWLMNHEVAHALYYTNPQFKAEMEDLTQQLDPRLHHVYSQKLIKMGYREGVVNDEIQAYLSTDPEDMGLLAKDNLRERRLARQYVRVFEKYWHGGVEYPLPFKDKIKKPL